MAITSPDSRSTSTAAFICSSQPSGSARAGRKPRVDVRPGQLAGSAPSHDADVTARNAEYLCVGTAQPRQDGFRLAGWCDVVTLGNHVKQICAQPLQIGNLSTN